MQSNDRNRLPPLQDGRGPPPPKETESKPTHGEMSEAAEASSAEPGADEPKISIPKRAKVVEVELLRKYCPRFIVDDDGEVTEQRSEPMVYYPAGAVLKLVRDEAIYAMRHENRIARPSEQAFDE